MMPYYRGRKRGQVAIEFIFLISIAFAVSVVFTYALLSQTAELNDEKEFVAVQDIAYRIQSEFIIASTVEDGYVRDFELPLMTHVFEYNITMLNNTLLVDTENKEYVLIIPDVTGEPKKGWNRICKENGTILIESGGCVYS